MVRSLENFPELATFRMAFLAHSFIMNFTLLVPLASYPAVEIWLETSLAGISCYASETLYSGERPLSSGRKR
jgi:hypothetical protein